MSSIFRLAPLAAALILAGCGTLAPSYERPAAPVAHSWPQGPAYAAAPAVGELPDWKTFFTDARLRDLIAQSLENNRDLRVAMLNVEQARAAYRISRSALFPNVGASASGSHSRSDGAGIGDAQVSHQYGAGIGASYELDLFGKVRSGNEAALNQFFATEEGARAARLTLIAEVANAWIAVAASRAQVEFDRTTLESQEASFVRVSRSYELGVASALELNQARTTVESARASLAASTRSEAQAVNALTLLAGSVVDEAKLPAAGQVAASVMPELPSSVPSEVLLRRPDIAQAERTLRAANANIGVARAAFFPSISLTAGGSRSSLQLSDLFSGGATYGWNWGPTISVPIFQGGALSAQLEGAQVARDIAVASYEKSIQSAFREVADALAARGTIDTQLAAQTALVKAASEAYRLSEQRFAGGIDSYLAVLESQRQMVAAQQALIRLEQQRAANLVTLYKVLGGGAEPAKG